MLWLGEDAAGAKELIALLQPYAAELLRAYPVDVRVGNVRNNVPALLAEIAA